MEEPQRVGDHAAAEDGFWCDRFAEVGQRIARAVRMVLHGHLGDFSLSDSCAISARVTSAAKAGIVVPYERSYGSSERPISSDTFGVGRCVIFSPPTTTTVSASPEAICAKPA